MRDIISSQWCKSNVDFTF